MPTKGRRKRAAAIKAAGAAAPTPRVNVNVRGRRRDLPSEMPIPWPTVTSEPADGYVVGVEESTRQVQDREAVAKPAVGSRENKAGIFSVDIYFQMQTQAGH